MRQRKDRGGYESGGGISGRADKQADGDREAARCGLTNQRNQKKETVACVFV